MTEANEAGGAGRGASAGQQLKDARKSRNLTIQQVAQALHLDPWILEALEENRFKDVGAPVFVKGHLRKYGSEVGLDTQELMEAYYRSEDTPETPRLVTDTFAPPGSEQRGRWPVIVVSVIIALLIFAVVGFWLRQSGIIGAGVAMEGGGAVQERSVRASEAGQVSVPATTEIANTLAETGDDSARPAAQVPVAATQAQALDQDPQPQAAAAPDQQEPVADGQVRLRITFRNDSWVEVYDAGNRRLFFDLARAGRTADLTGEPPLQVLLGNADDAEVRVNGDVYPIPAASRQGKTARFTVR